MDLTAQAHLHKHSQSYVAPKSASCLQLPRDTPANTPTTHLQGLNVNGRGAAKCGVAARQLLQVRPPEGALIAACLGQLM